jgi:hypothetical protein
MVKGLCEASVFHYVILASPVLVQGYACQTP